MNKEELIVNEEDSGMRIDKYINQHFNDLSRTQIQQLIKAKEIIVNSNSVKQNYKVTTDDTITIFIKDPEPLDVIPEDIPLDIIYEDHDVLVVNKPRGMVVHPAPGHLRGTLVNGLMFHCRDLSGINGVLRPGIVHRIDKDTSGLLMVAKNDIAHQSLVEQLKAKTTEREYVAIVHGVIQHDHGTIDAPIGRDEKDRKKMAVTERNSKQAITYFNVLKRYDHFTYVQCQLETGRTHQIRVHMKFIEHPVAGDPKYGPKKTLNINGQALHAAKLGFKHPRTGQWMSFEADVPDDMNRLLNTLEDAEMF